MRKRSVVRIILFLLAFYALLLTLLILVERANGTGGGIKDAGSALWYLTATLTTVGYGDVAPVTAAGRVIGAVLMLSSAGLFVYFLGLLFSLFFGHLVPKTRLWTGRKRPWYIFASCDSESGPLARDLAAGDPSALFVFFGTGNGPAFVLQDLPRKNVITDMGLGEVIAMHRGNAPVHVLFMGEDGWKGYSEIRDLIADPRLTGIRFCLETERIPDHIPGDVILFDRVDAIARSYWMQHPVGREEKLFLIAGDGRVAERLLERGLLMNVLPPEYGIVYHAAGDWEHFRRIHPELGEAAGDAVIYTKEAWNADPELLSRADRILFCADEEAVNLAGMTELFRYFPVTGKVYVYGRPEDPRAKGFGDPADVMTGENVLHSALNRIARRMNDFYRRRKENAAPLWEELTEFQRQSNIAAADHLLTKARLLLGEDVRVLTPEVCARAYDAFRAASPEERENWRRLEHARWALFHRMYNWRYGQTRQDQMRLHDCLVPYEGLSEEMQKLDDSAYELFGEFGEEGGL